MLKIALLGIQGSGKSTQAEALSRLLQLPMVSLGGILRRGIEEDDPFVTEFYPRSELDAGHLAPDSLVKAVLTRELEALDGFILEGFPRTYEQATFIDGVNLDYVVEIVLSESVVIQRLKARGRSDDSESGIDRRLRYYNDHILPIRDFFQEKKILRLIDGDTDIEEVTQRILSQIQM